MKPGQAKFAKILSKFKRPNLGPKAIASLFFHTGFDFHISIFI